MEAWKFVKEEPEDNEYHEDKFDYRCDALDSYSHFKSEEQCDDEIKIREKLYATLDFQQSCVVKVECKEEFLNAEENNNCGAQKTASSCYPRLSIPLVRLEHLRNQEVMKYLKPPLPAISAPTELQPGNETANTELNLKTESVELQTLTESTLVQSIKNYRYASPWDFVSVASTHDPSSSPKDAPKTEFADANGVEYESEVSKSFAYNSALPEDTINIQKTSLSTGKLNQTTLNFEVVSVKRRTNEKAITEATMQLPNFESPEHISELPPKPSHSDSPPQQFLSCESCNLKFIRKTNLIRHNRIKHGNECSSPSRTEERLNEAAKKYACTVCGKSFRAMQLMHRHCQTHDPTNWAQCDICKKIFKLKRYLRQHIQIHDCNQYPCNYCHRIYTHKATLRRHMAVHNAAGKTIEKPIQRKNISQVKKKKKPTDKKVPEPKNDSPLKLYECDVCRKRFEDKSSMKVHIEFLHIELFEAHAYTLPVPQSFNTCLKKPYECHICRKRYTQLSHLYRHKESHFPRKSHLCKLCGQNFTTTSSLSRHVIHIHKGIPRTRKKPPKKPPMKSSKDFRCKICGKAFRSLGDLRRHCAIHDERRPYECDTCKKQFAVKGYLYAHMLTHDNWKPYPCQRCTKVYRRKSSLQRHIYISHSAKNTDEYECSICNKSWKHEIPYRKHMKSCQTSTSDA